MESHVPRDGVAATRPPPLRVPVDWFIHAQFKTRQAGLRRLNLQ